MGEVGVRQSNHVLAVDVPPPPVQVVEAVVLLVDDHEVLVRAERAAPAPTPGGGRAGRQQADRQQGGGEDDRPSSPVRCFTGSSSGPRMPVRDAQSGHAERVAQAEVSGGPLRANARWPIRSNVTGHVGVSSW